MGSGGTGGYYGARLVRAGFHVTFIARGAHYRAMLEHGLSVTGLEEFRIPQVRVVENPTGLAPVDLVIFAVKTYDTDAAAQLITPLVGPETVILPIQNGVDSFDRLGAVHGYDRVVGGLCRISAEVAAPGEIRLKSSFSDVVMGEMDGPETVRIREVANALAEAGIPCTVSTDIRTELWKKFTFITALSGICGATRSPLGPIREVPEAFQLFRRIAAEVIAVGRAEGVAIHEGYADAVTRHTEGLDGSLKASLLVDLERGRPTEVETLQGAVIRMGRERGVATPVTEVAHALIKMFQGA